MIVLWIDPWTTTVWYAVLQKINNTISLLDYWVIQTTPKTDLSIKLIEIASDLDSLLNTYKPDRVVIEKLFFTTNLKTWIDVAQARWMMIYKFANIWIEILEYTPLELKSWICGNWKANKLQLQTAIKILLMLDTIPKPDDAADAIWLAYMWVLKK